MDPKKNVIYKQVKKQYDSYMWAIAMTGEVSVCFSNEFSTFSYKLVYMDFQVWDEEPLGRINFIIKSNFFRFNFDLSPKLAS